MSGSRRFDQLTIDGDARRVTVAGAPVQLTRTEFDLLATLVDRAGSAISNRELLEAMWDCEWRIDTTPLQVHVSRLRHKLGESGSKPRHIVTVRGFGYRFEPNPIRDHEGGRRSEGHALTEVVLRYDRDLLLQTIEPEVPVLGWAPQEIVGTYFAPTGTTRDTALAFLEHLWQVGFVEVAGDFRALARDGSEAQVHASIEVDLDRQGHFDGLRSRWMIPGGARPGASG